MHRALDNVFFVFGDGRSGNTFLSEKICAHLGATVPPESNIVTAIFSRYVFSHIDTAARRRLFSDIVFSDPKFADWGISRNEVDEILAHGALTREEALKEILSLYCEKQGANIQALGLQKNYIDIYPRLRRLFPNSKIVWIIRDGRAVFSSKKNNKVSDRSRYFETDPRRAALIWVTKNRRLQNMARRYRNTIRVEYEALIGDTESILKQVAAFLGLSYSAEVVGERPLAARYEDIHKNVKGAPLPGRASSWKEELSPDDIEAYEAVAGDALRLYGYPVGRGGDMMERLCTGGLLSWQSIEAQARKILAALRNQAAARLYVSGENRS